MATSDPYRAPRAAVRDRPDRYGEVRVFSVSGRLGRVRYIGYSVGFAMLFYAGIVAIGAGAGAVGPGWAGALIIALWVGLIVISLALTIQRCHDFNTTGWVSLLALIPLVAFIFWFIPGTDGENRFGLKAPPNAIGVILLASVVPLVFVAGVIAAIALPAYQDYTARAQAAGNPVRSAPR